jgi:hypothetical protein
MFVIDMDIGSVGLQRIKTMFSVSKCKTTSHPMVTSNDYVVLSMKQLSRCPVAWRVTESTAFVKGIVNAWIKSR